MKRISIAFALILALPVAVAAQGQGMGMGHGNMDERQGHGMGQGMMGAMHGMMMAHPGPGMLLRVQETLGLTEDQVERLEAMHEEAREAMTSHHEAAGEARARAHEAMMADTPDLDAFQSALEEAAQHNVQAMMAMARVHMQAAEVLTDGQRSTLDTLMQAMHEMRGEGMHGGEGMGEQMRQRQHQGMGQQSG